MAGSRDAQDDERQRQALIRLERLLIGALGEPWRLRRLVALFCPEGADQLPGPPTSAAALTAEAVTLLHRREQWSRALFTEVAAALPASRFEDLRSVAAELGVPDLTPPPPGYRPRIVDRWGEARRLGLVGLVSVIVGVLTLGLVANVISASAADEQYMQMVDLYATLHTAHNREKTHAVRALISIYSARCPAGGDTVELRCLWHPTSWTQCPHGIRTKRSGCAQLDLSYLDLSHSEDHDDEDSRYDPSLEGENLGAADLRSANLTGVYLANVDASGVYARDALLASADFTGAVLREASLQCADLSNADLSNADLRGAHLEGAILNGAILTGAHLQGAEVGTCKCHPTPHAERAARDTSFGGSGWSGGFVKSEAIRCP